MKRNLFFLFSMSPFIILVIAYVIHHYFGVDLPPFSEFFSKFFLALQLLFIIGIKITRKPFLLKTKVLLSEDRCIIKSEPTLFFKEKNIEISPSEINYFQITEYSFNVKNTYNISFKLSYNHKNYFAYFILNESEKEFINKFILYLKQIEEGGKNLNFYFKDFWISKKNIRKWLFLYILFAISLISILFMQGKNVVAFSTFLSLGILLQLFTSSKELSELHKKIKGNDYPFV
ncbi:MAG: hypothetical protein MH132_05380 [Hydrotalea sp.]|nr:hypothetical protein [Hydrotalea sp.]